MEYYGSYLAGMDVKPETGIDKLVASICKAKAAGTFQPYIDFIQFAKYRGFEAGTRISFEFPLTVLVGQNGSGKSSVLHALSGAPEKSSVGNYWFGTDLDPIDTEEPDTRRRTALAPSAKSAFWYGYTKNGVKHEVLKCGYAAQVIPTIGNRVAQLSSMACSSCPVRNAVPPSRWM